MGVTNEPRDNITTILVVRGIGATLVIWGKFGM
jgi:hypothetical protein